MGPDQQTTIGLRYTLADVEAGLDSFRSSHVRIFVGKVKKQLRNNELTFEEFDKEFVELLAKIGEGEIKMLNQLLLLREEVMRHLEWDARSVIERAESLLDQTAVLDDVTFHTEATSAAVRDLWEEEQKVSPHYISTSDLLPVKVERKLFRKLEDGEKAEEVVLDINHSCVVRVGGHDVNLIAASSKVMEKLGLGGMFASRLGEEYGIKPVTVFKGVLQRKGRQLKPYELFVEDDVIEAINSRFYLEADESRGGRRTLVVNGQEIEVVGLAYRSWERFGVTKPELEKAFSLLKPLRNFKGKVPSKLDLPVYAVSDVLRVLYDNKVRKVDLDEYGVGYYYHETQRKYIEVIGDRFLADYLGVGSREDVEEVCGLLNIDPLIEGESRGTGSKRSRRIYSREILDEILARKLDDSDKINKHFNGRCVDEAMVEDLKRDFGLLEGIELLTLDRLKGLLAEVDPNRYYIYWTYENGSVMEVRGYNFVAGYFKEE